MKDFLFSASLITAILTVIVILAVQTARIYY